jgi:hypothetical protein
MHIKPYLSFPRGRVRILDRGEFVVHVQPLERDRRQQLVAAECVRRQRQRQLGFRLGLAAAAAAAAAAALVAGRRGRFDRGRFGEQALIKGGALRVALLRRVLAGVRVVDCEEGWRIRV